MADPCTPKQCRPNEKWDTSSCSCIKSGSKTFKSLNPKLGTQKLGTTLIPKGKK